MLMLCMISGASMASDSTTIYVVRRGWHIDIGLPVGAISAPLRAVIPSLPGARNLFFGFADKHYLLAAHRNAPVLLSALWPGAGVMLVTGLSDSAQQGFGREHVIELKLGPDQNQALQAFIWSSLRTQNGAIQVYQQGPYAGSVYFLAQPTYSALHTCNTWAAQALRAAGLRVHSAGVIFAGQLWLQARRLKRAQDRADTRAAYSQGGLLPS